MLDLKDINHVPSIAEISEYIDNPLFDRFYEFMGEQYKALVRIEYSRDVWYPGWNIKLRKAGRSLCAVYPKRHCFTVLVVVGIREKAGLEKVLPQLSSEMQEIYCNTREGNGQRWLMIDLDKDNRLYQDTLSLIRIRREAGR